MSTFTDFTRNLDSAIYDLKMMKLDYKNGNFSMDSTPLQDYRKNYIVMTSAINGQWAQAKQQFKDYNLQPANLTGMISDAAIRRIS